MSMPMGINTLAVYRDKSTHAAPLAVFRIFFGILMLFSTIRFWYNGWIEKLYLEPDFHFKYYGFSWVEVPSESICYALFILCGLSALCVAIGFKYRWAIVTFFLSFTYIELMDKTTYLNHYYFVSVISAILIFLPAHRYFSIDAYKNPHFAKSYIPRWNIDALKIFITIVYLYAGAAKLNYDWMVNAMPLAIWLPTKFSIPILGDYMHEKWVHYFFSWGGALYDLTIPFLLMWRRTRIVAFIAVLLFHIMTRILFPIGMFPYIMIMATLIFFDAKFHNRLLASISSTLGIDKSYFDQGGILSSKNTYQKRSFNIITLTLIFQLLIPLRFLAYPGNLFWTEEGYRFSWRVMLMEKTGYAQFKIVDGKTGKRFYVDNGDFLSPFQQKQMSTQPDFIIQYAHYLGEHFRHQGHKNIEVYVESYAALNGRKSQPFINPDIDLMKVEYNLSHRHILVPLYE